MKLLERVDGIMAATRASIEIAREGGDPAVVVIELRERLQTLREELLTVREEVTTLREEKRELEERLAEAQAFTVEREKYAVITLETGSTVCVSKEPAGGEQQRPMYFCARCFEKGSREILEVKHTDFNRDTYYCPACGSTALIPNGREMTAYTVPIANKFRGL